MAAIFSSSMLFTAAQAITVETTEPALSPVTIESVLEPASVDSTIEITAQEVTSQSLGWGGIGGWLNGGGTSPEDEPISSPPVQDIDIPLVPNDPTVVPIPAAAWLFGSGLAGLAAWRRKSKTGMSSTI